MSVVTADYREHIVNDDIRVEFAAATIDFLLRIFTYRLVIVLEGEALIVDARIINGFDHPIERSLFGVEVWAKDAKLSSMRSDARESSANAPVVRNFQRCAGFHRCGFCVHV
jgi:hypothetical protein